jgi:phage FluMu gp28-like protein
MSATATAAAAAGSYFLPYQDRWIADEARLKIAEKSRRVGFTYASSYRMFKKCMERGDGYIQWVSSRDQFTAQELIRDYVARWCRLANVAAKGMHGDNVQVFDTARDIRAFVCQFPNGARIVSLASTPEVFAGKGGDVFLDEVDLHKDSGRLVDMALPCVTWGGQLEMVSAYRVDGSAKTPFAQMVAEAKNGNKQGASLHRVTIHDAVAEGIVEKINEASGQTMTREAFVVRMRGLCRTLAAWMSQYECVPQDAGGRLLPFAEIAACEMDAVELAALLAANPKAPRFAGYDVARRVHACAWHEYAQVGVTLFLARREVFRDMKFDDQENWIRSRLEDKAQPRIARMAIDATGLGMHMAERLSGDYPGRVDAVNLESHRRHELCLMLADRVQRRQVAFPPDDQLRADLNAPLKTVAANGALRIEVPSFSSADGEVSHADEFMAAVLALSAADSAPAGAPPTVARCASVRRHAAREARRNRSMAA